LRVLRTLRALGLSALALLAIPAAVHADPPPTQIGFDDLSPETKVVEQYAGLGVHFAHPYAFGINRNNPPSDVINSFCTGGPENEGTLRVVDGGISGRSGYLTCGLPEFDKGFDEAFQFDYWRHGVSFKVRSQPRVGYAGPQPLTVRLLGKNTEVLQRFDYELPPGQVTPLSYARLQSDIAYVELSGEGQLWLDDVEAPVDVMPPPPAYRLALVNPALSLVEGASGKVPIKVIRFNGSSGPVPLTVASLPAGIAAAAVEPNPIGGTAPGALRVTASAPALGERQVMVSAAAGAPPAAGTATGGPVTLTVQLEPALVIDDDFAQVQRAIAVPGCGGVETRRGLTVRGGFKGTVLVLPTILSGPVKILSQSNLVESGGDGRYEVGFTLGQDAGVPGDSEIQLRFKPLSGASEATVKLHVFAEPVSIDAIAPASLARARPIQAGERVSLSGSFPRGCSLYFQDGVGDVLPVVGSDPGGGGEAATRTVELDPMSASGPIAAIARDEPSHPVLAKSPSLDVREMRNTAGLFVTNEAIGGASDYSWSDFIRAFGNDDADACTPFGCFRDPFAVSFWHDLQDELGENRGLCVGYSTMARRFDRGIELPSAYLAGARRAWEISDFSEGTAIKDQMVRWQIAQRDTDWMDFLHGLRGSGSPAALRSSLEEGIRAHGSMYVLMFHGAAGHVAVAYAVQAVLGGFDILTYNPNTPYALTEEVDGRVREGALGRSAIRVRDKSWNGGIFSGADGDWWSGDMSSIDVFDVQPPSNATMPDRWRSFVVFGPIAKSAGDGPPKAPTVSSIRIGGEEALRGDGTTKPGSGASALIVPSGIEPDVSYRLPHGRPATLTLRGAASGRYTESALGDGVAAGVEGAHTARGQSDTLTLTSGSPRIGFASGGDKDAATLSLISRMGRGAGSSVARSADPARSADVSLAVGGGRADALALTDGGGTVELRHDGPPTKAAVTLGASGASGPQTAELAPLPVGAGQRLQLRPLAWNDLGEGVAFIVRDRRGAVVRSGKARIRPSGLVRLALHLSVRSKPNGRVVVGGRVRKPGGAPLLVVTVQALRHGRQVARRVVALKGRREIHRGRFSLPVALPKSARGATLRAVATLTDEAADYATARATGQAGPHR
jgi:hypothetical protein